MQISSGVSNTCLFAPAPYYKLNKGFFRGFLFKPLGGLRPPRGLNKKASEKYLLSITYCLKIEQKKPLYGSLILPLMMQEKLVLGAWTVMQNSVLRS